MSNLWNILTNFGDSASLGPVALVIAIVLVAGGAWRTSAAWSAIFLFAIAFVAATKIVFVRWGWGIPALRFTGISGHTALATIVFLVVAFLLTRRASFFVRIGAILAAGLLAAVIGISRLALQFHSPSEVIAGLVFGAMLALVFIRIARTHKAPVLSPLITVPVLVIVTLAGHGHEAPSQSLIAKFALQASGHVQPHELSRRG